MGEIFQKIVNFLVKFTKGQKNERKFRKFKRKSSENSKKFTKKCEFIGENKIHKSGKIAQEFSKFKREIPKIHAHEVYKKFRKVLQRRCGRAKRENFDKEIFAQKMQKNAEIFDKCEAAELNSAYLKDLQGFVNACLAPKCDKQRLLAKANALDKLKNAKKKGEKHKKNARNYDSSDI